MKVEQTAGVFRIEVYTDGHPLWPSIFSIEPNGDKVEVRTNLAGLHDLRYCIDRVLAQLGGKNG